jgi:hypothetical protein
MGPELHIDIKNLLPEQQIKVLAVSGYIKALAMQMQQTAGLDRAAIKIKHDSLLDLANKLRIVVEMDSISGEIFGDNNEINAQRATKQAIQAVLDGLMNKILEYGNITDACMSLLKSPTSNIRTVLTDESTAPLTTVRRLPFDPTNPLTPVISPFNTIIS